MNISELKSLITNGESTTIEFKQSIAELDKLGKAMCGFLNTHGGYGIIGISDSGNILGIEVTDSTKKKLTAFCNFFDPWPNLVIDYISIPKTDKFVVVINAPFNIENSPFTYKGRAYIKTESGKQLMSSEQYKSKLLAHAWISKAWEAISSKKYTIDALDHSEIIRTFKIGQQEKRIPDDEYTETPIEILTHFDLIDGGIINHAAMVLFGKKLTSDYSQCFIRMGRFIDKTMDEVLDSKQVRGNAFQILAEAQNFITKHLPISSRFQADSFERIDEPALPFVAVREAIINAICHRDYSNPAGDISLYIFNDALEIHNIGHLFGGLTI